MVRANRGLTLEEVREQREEILRIAAAYGAHNVRVFGSVARSESGPESDIDFLVDIESEHRGFEFFSQLENLRRALEGLLDCSVDVSEEVQGHARPSVEQDVIPL